MFQSIKIQIGLLQFLLVAVCASTGVCQSTPRSTSSSFESVSVKSFGCKTGLVCVNKRDEFWTVNLRDAHLIESCQKNPECQMLADGKWQSTELSDLVTAHQSDLTKTTIVYVHGNRTDADWAITRGLQAYSNLFNGNAKRPSIRFVIVQWRSEPELKLVGKDYSLKAKRAVALGAAFGRLNTGFGVRKPILLGYSLGAQIIMSSLSESQQQPAGTQKIAFVAPAIESTFSTCGIGECENTASHLETSVFSNSKDVVIRFSKRIGKKACASFDYESVLNGCGPVKLGKVSRFDISSELGKQHSIVKYSQSPTLIREINCLINK